MTSVTSVTVGGMTSVTCVTVGGMTSVTCVTVGGMTSMTSVTCVTVSGGCGVGLPLLTLTLCDGAGAVAAGDRWRPTPARCGRHGGRTNCGNRRPTQAQATRHNTALRGTARQQQTGQPPGSDKRLSRRPAVAILLNPRPAGTSRDCRVGSSLFLTSNSRTVAYIDMILACVLIDQFKSRLNGVFTENHWPARGV